jgi:3-hydroxy-9,10-secoandrosta-1,3,5(10)-triene-9,17-dione monooxygenase
VELQTQRVRAAFVGERGNSDPFSQVRIARAASEIDAAWALLTNNIRALQDYVAKGVPIPLHARLKVRRDQVVGTERAIEAIDLLFENSGARALDRGCHLQRVWRDAHAGRVHAANDPERALQLYGAAEVGLKTAPGMY